MKFHILFAGITGVLAAVATPTATTNTLVQILASGATSTKTLLTAECWSDGQVPHADADYLVARSGTIRLPEGADSFDFEGNSLQVGSDSVGASFYQKPASLNFKNDGLFLKKGQWGHWASNQKPKVNGTVTVLAKASAPFNFVSDNANTGYEFTGAWHAAADCAITLKATNAANSYDKHRLILSGDLSDYQGRITVASRAILAVGKTTLPGEIVMDNASPGAGWFEAIHDDDVLEVDALTLKSGVKLMPKMRLATAGQPATGSIIRVTRKLAVTSSPVYVMMPDALTGVGQADEMRIPMLTLAAGAEGALNVSDFAISNTASALRPEQVSLDVTTDAESGDTTLFLVRSPVIVLTKDNTGAAEVNPDDPGQTNVGGLSSPNYWSDGLTPHPGAVYNQNGKVLRTYYGAESDVFSGDALVVNGSFVLQAKEVVVSNLYISTTDSTKTTASLCNWHPNGDKTTNTFAVGGTKVLKGNKMVMNASLSHGFSSIGGYVRLDIPIEGAGSLNFGMYANQPAGNAYFELAGDNSKWTGALSITVGTDTVKRPEHTFTNTVHVFFREACNLGGRRQYVHTGAVTLQGKSILHPLQTVTVDEPTRGVTIGSQGAGIQADSNIVFTLRQQLTLQGELTKFGAGTLALGGRTAFGNSSTYEPGSTPYTIDIQEGGLKVVETNAVDGVTFTFGAAGALETDPEATGDVATYGIYDVKVDAPFGRAPNGYVPVRVALPAGYENEPHPISATICTVNATAAASLGTSAFAVARPAQCRTYVTAKTNDDGTVTYTANVAPSGMIFTIR